MLAMVIPAAGQSARLGQPKQLIDFHGEPLLQNRLKLGLSVCERVYCVLGANAGIIKPAMAVDDCHWIEHAGWQQGLGSSIAAAIDGLDQDVSAILIMLCDQWALTAQDLQTLMEHWQQSPEKLHAASYSDTFGVPAIIPRQYFAELQALCRNQSGAKALLKKHKATVVSIPMNHAEPDIDTPAQLAALTAQKQSK